MMNRTEQFFAIDLFAGCGGLSEGFIQAGFEIAVSIEKDKFACETLRTRHLYCALKRIKRLHLYDEYLKGKVSKEDIFKKNPTLKKVITQKIMKVEFGKNRFEDITNNIKKIKKEFDISNFHVLLGGPPCQAYSLAGRARDPDRMENDKRHFLFQYYLHILENIKPDFFIFENVPGLLSAKASGEKIFRKLLDDFSAIDPAYEIAPSYEEFRKKPKDYLLNSADFKIPQTRKRMILIGYKQKLESRYPEVRQIFRKILDIASRNKEIYTVDDAIGDLPRLKPREGNDLWYGEYKTNKMLKKYQTAMRKNSPGILNHKARSHMKSDLKRYKFFIEHHKNGNGAATLKNLKKEKPDLLPDHKNLTGFIDRFKVQWWNQPSSTITAHIHKDGHYYIHPDISQCRSFTVREAARCQSFPDNYKFEGPRTEQFRQVGNAVPPRLAFVVAKFIIKELNKIYAQNPR